MMRSSFFATGLFIALWGVSLLFVDQVVLDLKSAGQRETGFRGLFTPSNRLSQRTVDPPDWAAFSLMSIGSVTMLYAVALPKKKKDDK